MIIETVKSTEGLGYLVNGKLGVPNDPANRHYRMVQDWIAAGNTPDLYVPPENNTSQITKLELKRQAVEEGIWGQIKGVLAGDADMQEDFDITTKLDITHTSVIALGQAVGKEGQDLQDFFNNAHGKV